MRVGDPKDPASWFAGGSERVRRLVALRKDLHRHPELSFREHRTTERLASELAEAGFADISRFEGTGLAVRIAGASEGDTVAVRGDIDALPIQEATGCDFASSADGVMHACGHDVHASWALGAALLLAESPAAGDVVVVFQPAEETGRGAQVVLDSGVLDEVDFIFGAHVDPRWVVGEAVVQSGPGAAAADEFSVTIQGAGGHGARPQLGRDPIVAAASLVSQVQTLVSRRVTPGNPAVVTIGEVHAGTAPNVIPDSAQLTGTIRSSTPEARVLLHEGLREISQGIAVSYGVEIAVDIPGGTPPLINHATATGFARDAALELLEADALHELPEPNMGGEDFALYLEQIPGCFLRVGSRFRGDAVVGAHTPRFFPRTECVFVGAALLAEAARRASRAKH